ncbi:MAG: hypothetical protein LBQ42_13635 [Synergistaceae bacterium]|jgi:hypothetical protein|nr:hypothetical protein [Synergistaceae bacterium]
MANLDVADVLDDPDFNSTFQVARRARDVGDDGRATVTDELLTLDGVIQPMNNRDLERLAQGDRLTGGITAWCREPLRTVGESHVADEILWGGSRYQVVLCNVWEYGAGYWQVQALLALRTEGYDNG